MGLIDDFMDTFTLVDAVTRDDGYGGVITEYQDGATITAAMTFDTSMQARIGQKQGVSSMYTITTKRNVVLRYHQILRRQSDGKILRVTSDGDDKFTPQSATLDMRQVTAEEWSIPNG